MGDYVKTIRDFRLLGSLYIPLLVFVIALTAGCAMNSAKLEPDSDIDGKFKNTEIISGYRYFHYSIGGYKTYAILGLDPDYTLETRLWQEFDPRTDAFPKLVNQLTRLRGTGSTGYWSYGYLNRAHGFRLLDLAGREMGVLFTNLSGTTVLLRQENRVVVNLREPGKRGGGR